MQTFLPSSNIENNPAMLDWRRLGKQRSEAKMIINALERGNGGWYHHPAVQMWRGHEGALKWYYNLVVEEWMRRGYRNTMPFYELPGTITLPEWWGRPIHASHRAALLFKAHRRLLEAQVHKPSDVTAAVMEVTWYESFHWLERPDVTDLLTYVEFPHYYWPR